MELLCGYFTDRYARKFTGNLAHARATITRPNFTGSDIKAKIRPGIEAKLFVNSETKKFMTMNIP